MISIRRTGGWLAILASGAFLLSGCNSPADGSASGDPIRGGTITVAIDSVPSQFDIHTTAADVSAALLRNVFDSLVVQDSDGAILPWLAESWEISGDGLEYTFDLRDDVTFTDGERFNAAAVKANFDHIEAPETASQYAAALLGGDAYAGTEVLDDDTVKVKFSRPFAPFLQGASTTYLGFYSPKVIEESSDKLLAGGPGITVGTGPFILDEVVAGQEISFSTNPDYNWAPANASHAGPAYPNSLVYRILPENAVRAGALTSGEVDVASNVAPNDVPALEADGAVSVSGTDAPGIPYSLFLNQSRGVFQDKLVRQGFQRGIDIGAAVTAVYGGQYDRAWSAVSPTTPNSYDPSVEGTWEYDKVLANQLLDEAGWTGRDSEGYRTKDGVRLSAEWPTFADQREDRGSLVDAFQADLKKIGFELKPRKLDNGAYVKLLYSGSYDVADWSSEREDADILRLHLYSGFAPGQNAGFVNDPNLDQLLVRASESTDADERHEIYSEVQRWVIGEAALVPIYVPNHIVAVSSAVGGVRVGVTGWPLLYDAWTSK